MVLTEDIFQAAILYSKWRLLLDEHFLFINVIFAIMKMIEI